MPISISKNCTMDIISGRKSDAVKSGKKITSKISKIKNEGISPPTAKTKPVISWMISLCKEILKINTSTPPNILGMTINPKVASKFEDKVKFDGTGKVVSFKQNEIKKQDYNILMENRIKPLSETPQVGECKIRTPGEAMIDIASLINMSNVSLSHQVEISDLIKTTWLDGSLSRQSLHNLVELVKLKVGGESTLTQQIEDVMCTLEKDFFVTKRNDNYYGRLFETELSKYIINNPNEEMIKVRDSVSTFILGGFSKASYNEQNKLCRVISRRMRADPPSWRHNLPLANKFMKDSRPSSFIEMMRYSGDFSIPLVLSLAVKYIVSAKETVDLKINASQYYTDEIKPQRQLLKSFNANKKLKTNTYGLLLPYQISSPSKDEGGVSSGVRPIDKYTRPTAGVALTEHDTTALANERTIGIGMSGSSNIMHFLFKKLQSQDEYFPIDDAKLATASWLSYSGGHSYNEAYSVFGFMSNGNFKPLSFNTLSTTNQLSTNAISFAYDKVIEASIKLRG